MASLRPKKRLSCFYCGRKSALFFQGQQSFNCTNCESTNWLDQDGDITDPPASSSPAPSIPVQYAVPRSRLVEQTSPSASPPPAAADDTLFCATCLRNQHMLTSSLAQFEWPDDTRGAEYLAREKQYYTLRKDLERRYPQMCADCEPKVEQKLRAASYTAQTDHLKRMMDRTRTRQQQVKQRTFLDVVDLTGQCAWHVGFVLQLMWHATVFWDLFLQIYNPPEEMDVMVSLMAALRRLTIQYLPPAELFIRWAINLGLCSFLWNPRFKQTIRGFTAHILGFQQWYTYQLLVLLIRFSCLLISQYSESKGLPVESILVGQAGVLVLVVYVYRVSMGAIRTDTAPLFQQKFKASTRAVGEPVSKKKAPAPRKDQSMGDVLDDIFQSSSNPQQGPAASPPQVSFDSQRSSPGLHSSPPGVGLGSGSLRNQRPLGASPEAGIGSLRLSERSSFGKPAPPPVHYDEEMDWSPSASQHRAFSSYNPYNVKNSNPRFNDTPIEPKSGPIWYKVPPAPTNPAQRLRNPPMRPIIRESPKDTQATNIFQDSSSRGQVNLGNSSQDTLSSVQFKDPKFFAPGSKDDPRNDLTQMFASSFNISPSPEEQEMRDAHERARSWENSASMPPADLISRKRTLERATELAILISGLWGWVSALDTQETYGPSFALAALCVCMLVSWRLTMDILMEGAQQEQNQHSGLRPSWAHLAALQILASLVIMGMIWSDREVLSHGMGMKETYGLYGNVLFGVAVGHHVKSLLI